MHNDYTLESAPRRVAQLAQPLGANDTLRARVDAPPPLVPAQLPRLLAGRWQLVNVWRNVAAEPVARLGLGTTPALTLTRIRTRTRTRTRWRASR